MKFGVGQPVRRFEDQTLITGKGRYTDDIHFENTAYAYVLRARLAHANIRKIDVSAAKGMPGVLLVLTGQDIQADSLGDVPCHAPLNNRDGSPRHDTPRPTPGGAPRGPPPPPQALAGGRGPLGGRRLVWVVAETWAQAQDAGEEI